MQQLSIVNEIIMQANHYCEHFNNLKLTKTIDLGQQLACKICHLGKSYLWLCLAKNCGCLACDRNKKQHIKMHLEQSKNKKSFHSIFINILTAQIICIHCDIEIYDLDDLKFSNQTSNFQDPFYLRVKILPALGEFNNPKSKIMGQLQNSEGHKKMNHSLTGLFSNRKSHAINSALQFLMQFQLYREIVLNLKSTNKQIEELSRIFYEAEQANFRAIHTEELVKILMSENHELTGYKRKDPFQHIVNLMTKIHERIKYYTLDYENSQTDAWDFLGNPSTSNRPNLNCPLFDNTQITLTLNYSCQKCKREHSQLLNLNFLKLSFPKKKRKAKQIEKQLVEHRFESPLKNRRRKSLINFFIPQQQCPFTLPQLIIDFLKQPYHKDKICSSCKELMSKNKSHFQNLADYLIIQVNRMGSDGNSVDQTQLQFSEQPIDFGPFTSDRTSSIIYQLQTAICIQNTYSYPVIAKSKMNKQFYLFKNEVVGLLSSQNKKKLNPYILCYKKKCQANQYLKIRDCFHNIKSNIQIQQQQFEAQSKLLPDFWLCQLKFNIVVPLKNQMICKHKRLKPEVESKMKSVQRVPNQVFQYLLQLFKGQRYTNSKCLECQDENQKIKHRKLVEKQKIIHYEKLKTSLSVMISQSWIKKWMNFLYKKSDFAYLSKGYPFPGPIDNKNLLEGQKCKANMRKNQDYKVVNIFVWRFLKQIYGGGPQIRYKWNKKELNQFEQETIKEIKVLSKQIKDIYMISYVESPKKSMVIQKTTSYVESVRGSEEGEDLSLPQQIQ